MFPSPTAITAFQKYLGDLPGGPVANHALNASMVGELRSHMNRSQKKQNIKQKQYIILKKRSNIVTNSIKTLKMFHMIKIF